jgi:hypothetical protein
MLTTSKIAEVINYALKGMAYVERYQNDWAHPVLRGFRADNRPILPSHPRDNGFPAGLCPYA